MFDIIISIELVFIVALNVGILIGIYDIFNSLPHLKALNEKTDTHVEPDGNEIDDTPQTSAYNPPPIKHLCTIMHKDNHGGWVKSGHVTKIKSDSYFNALSTPGLAVYHHDDGVLEEGMQ
jgi:hypothetical protein